MDPPEEQQLAVISSDSTANSQPEEDDTQQIAELMSPEQEVVYKRRLELKRTQQDLIKLLNRLHEFVNRDRNASVTDNSSCGDVVAVENLAGEEDGVDWELLTAFLNQHVTELQEIRSLSTFTGLLMNRIKKIIGGPCTSAEKLEDGKSKEDSENNNEEPDNSNGDPDDGNSNAA